MLIPLMDALGVTPSMPPADISARWVEWSGENPAERAKLSPVVVTEMDALSVAVATFQGVQDSYNFALGVYMGAIESYNAAMLILCPPQGVMLEKQLLFQASVAALDDAMKVFIGTVQDTVNKLTNTKVDENTALTD